MKPSPNTPPDRKRLLAFGAHPDDIEFGAGAIVAGESRAGTEVSLIVCSEGESASHGTPAERRAEAREAATILGAQLEFISLGGDAHFEKTLAATLAVAATIRRFRPQWILAPTPVPGQHPDHSVLGAIVRDAARLARYGGLSELRSTPAHAIDQLYFFAVGPEGEMADGPVVWIDVSDEETIGVWKRAMSAHGTQARARDYLELQLTRARLLGLRAGVSYAQALFPADPVVVTSLAQLGRGARRF